jgi:hypothetical protein
MAADDVRGAERPAIAIAPAPTRDLADVDDVVVVVALHRSATFPASCLRAQTIAAG